MRIFIGYDSREPLSYHVLSHSIMRRASIPVSIHPLVLNQLGGAFWRLRGPTESTEFSISRFLTPYLSNYEGWSLFLDSDMLCLMDVAELEGLISRFRHKAVVVAKHDYTPKDDFKFLGQGQTKYPRKNWSSVMLMNNALCRPLTPEFVNTASGLTLHRFEWVDDNLIGDFGLEHNWLVGEYDPGRPWSMSEDGAGRPSDIYCSYPVLDAQHCAPIKFLHYTLGGPWFPDTENCDHADLWRAELNHMMGKACEQFTK